MYSGDAIESVSFTSEDNRNLKVEYFITNSSSQAEGSEGMQTYGVKAELSAPEQQMEKVQIDDVSPLKDEVLKLIKILAKNKVTPVTLKDVVEDYITAQYDMIN